MAIATKERIIGNRLFSTERYIRSTHPVLYMPLWKKDGLSIRSEDAFGHIGTVNGAIWTQQGRYLDGADDDIVLNDGNAGSPLNFTTQNFSVMGWVNTAKITGGGIITNRGDFNVDGWYCYQDAAALTFVTNQAGASQATTSANVLSVGVPVCVSFVRSGANVKIFLNNGEVAYNAQGVHVNPLSTAKATRLGIFSDDVSLPFSGTLSDVVVPARAITLAEHQQFYQSTRWRYQ